jgi:dynein intermediate chain
MADSARTTRAAALEEKKRRLEELKQRRALRSEAPTATAPQQNLDEYIDGLLASPAPAEDAAKEEVPPLQEEGDTAPAPPLQDQKPKQPLEAPPSAQPAVTLAAPKVETFEFGTQTNDEDFVRDDEDEAADEEERGRVETADESQVPEGHPEAPIALEPRILSEEEKQETVDKVQFSSFLNTASKKVERILGEPVLAELLVNVVGETDGLEIEDKKTTSQFVSARHAFSHPKWTAGRTVTDIAWSNLHRELLLSSYDTLTSGGTGLLRAVSPDVTPSASLAPRSGELQSDGLVVVWNLALPTRPEHVLTCGSPVHAARFHPTTSPLIVGGCRNGQLVVWDVRAGRLPVQRSGQGYPITSMQVGEGNVSTDFRIEYLSLHASLNIISHF